MEPIALERYGAPYWQCPAEGCPYEANNRAYVAAHLRDHDPRPTLDEVLAAQETEPAAPARRRKETP